MEEDEQLTEQQKLMISLMVWILSTHCILGIQHNFIVTANGLRSFEESSKAFTQ